MSIRCEKVFCERKNCKYNCKLDNICLCPTEIFLRFVIPDLKLEGVTSVVWPLECSEYKPTEKKNK